MRAYFVFDREEDKGDIVIAENNREAKRISIKYSEYFNFHDIPFTDMRVRWLRNADITGLEKGIQDDTLELMRRRIVAYQEDEECPICENMRYSVHVHDFSDRKPIIACIDCAEKYENDYEMNIAQEAVPYGINRWSQ